MNLLQACIDVLFFHHPAAWWISDQVRAEREHCADDLAVRVLEAGHAGSRLSYAKALLALEERRQAHALALAANGGSLLDRICRLAGVEEQPASPVRPLATALTASLLVAVLITAAALIREARAHELPKNTNQIESLTVEQAKKLVDEFPGVTVQVDRTRSGKLAVRNCLPLNGLRTLDASTAQTLVAFEGPLVLNGLTTLDIATAKALAESRSLVLWLDGLTTLEAEAARALATFRGIELNFSGLRRLTPETARALTTFANRDSSDSDSELKKNLHLHGLAALEPEVAAVLAEYGGFELGLNGVAEVDEAAADAVATFKAAGLFLNGVTTLDAVTARSLAMFKGYLLHLDGLTTIDPATATALATRTGYALHLDGLPSLSAEAARALAGFNGRALSLAGLTTLNADAARALGESKSWDGRLPMLNAFDAATAAALAALEKWNGELPSITAFKSPDSVAIAKALATRKGPLSLPNLKKVSPKTLSALIEKEDIDIPLIETLELIPEPDGSPTEDFVIPEGFRTR